MNPESSVLRPSFVTKVLAMGSLATFWMIPFSPFVIIAALVRTKSTGGWPYRISVTAALLCSVLTIAYASIVYCATIYILNGGLNQ